MLKYATVQQYLSSVAATFSVEVDSISSVHAELTKAIDSFELARTDMQSDDTPRLYELSITVNWPHCPKDWELILSLGRRYVARDEIGRVLGSAMWFPMGETLASIGMVITSPRLQDHGAGRWLMQHVLADTTGRDQPFGRGKGMGGFEGPVVVKGLYEAHGCSGSWSARHH